MPVAAAPIIGAGIGAAGNFLSAKAAQPKNVAAPKPNALFPGQQQAYLNELTNSGVGKTSFSTINEAAKTGLPVDQGSFFDALKSSMQRSKSEDEASLIEKFGSRGLRNSSDLMKAGTDYELQSGKDFATILADYTRQAGEAAAGRRVGAAGLGASLAGEPGLAMTPSSTLVTGSPSGAGTALSGVGNSIQQILLMKSLFPDVFGGKSGGTSGGGAGAYATGTQGPLS